MQNSLIDQLGIKITSDFYLTFHKEFLFFGRKEIWILKGTTVMLLWENCFLIWNFDFSGEMSVPKPQNQTLRYLRAAAPTHLPGPTWQNPMERSHTAHQQTTSPDPRVRTHSPTGALSLDSLRAFGNKRSSSQCWEWFCSAVASHCRLNLRTCFSPALPQGRFLPQPPSPAGGRQLTAGLGPLRPEHGGRAAGREPQPSLGCWVSGLPSNTRPEGHHRNPALMEPVSAQPPGLRSCLPGFSLVNALLWLSMSLPRCQTSYEGIWPF